MRQKNDVWKLQFWKRNSLLRNFITRDSFHYICRRLRWYRPISEVNWTGGQASKEIYVYYRTLRYVSSETTAKINNIPCKLCLTPSYVPDIKLVTANSVKFSSVSCKVFPSNTGEPSRSTFKACFLGFDLDTIAGIRQYPLSFSLFERFEQSSTAQKFTIAWKLQDYLQIGP